MAQCLGPLNCKDEAKCYLFFVAGTRTSIWINLVLKLRNAVLGKVRVNMTYETVVKLRIVPVFGSTDLLTSEMVGKAREKLSRTVHDQAIRKAVAFERNPSQLPAKQRQTASQGSRPKSSCSKHCKLPQCSRLLLTRKGASSKTTSQTPSNHGRGEKF